MGSNYKDINAICPFYQGIENNASYNGCAIICEGINKDTRIKLQFNAKEGRNTFKAIHCDRDFPSCMLAKMLDGKYV